MSASAMGAKLTKKKNDSVSSDTEWAVGSLLSIGSISVETEERDITTLDSPNGAKEYEQGTKNAGDVDFKILLKKGTDKASVTKITALIAAGTTESWEVEWPDGSKFAFNGYVKSYEAGELTPDGNVEFTATIKVSGLPTFTAGV